MTGGSVGQQLKSARTELQLSLKDVTQATKIQPWILDALEADRLQTTMSPIYVKSFLSTYAKFLRLDTTPLIAQLFPPPPPTVQKELAPAKPARAIRTRPVQTTPIWPELVERFGPILRRLGTLAIGAGLVAGLIAANPLKRLAPLVRRKEASLAIAPKKTAAKIPTETALSIQPTVPLELGLTAHRPTWVSVKSDGQLVAQQRLAADSRESWKAHQRFELIIAEPSQVDVTLNGQSITPLALAHRGRIVITHTAVKPLGASAPAVAGESRKDAPEARSQAAEPRPVAKAPAPELAATPHRSETAAAPARASHTSHSSSSSR